MDSFTPPKKPCAQSIIARQPTAWRGRAFLHRRTNGEPIRGAQTGRRRGHIPLRSGRSWQDRPVTRAARSFHHRGSKMRLFMMWRHCGATASGKRRRRLQALVRPHGTESQGLCHIYSTPSRELDLDRQSQARPSNRAGSIRESVSTDARVVLHRPSIKPEVEIPLEVSSIWHGARIRRVRHRCQDSGYVRKYLFIIHSAAPRKMWRPNGSRLSCGALKTK